MFEIDWVKLERKRGAGDVSEGKERKRDHDINLVETFPTQFNIISIIFIFALFSAKSCAQGMYTTDSYGA